MRFAFLLLAIVPLAWSNTVVRFRTYYGDMDVELFEQHKPLTTGNFLRYLRNGLYDNGFIHRCNPTFVIQGGGFAVDEDIGAIPTYPPIPNEYGAGTIYSNLYGTIAMAKLGGQTNSATSQWFINLKNNPSLDARDSNNLFTVFGKVIRGTNVLNRFKTFSVSNTRSNVIRDYSFFYGPSFGEVPLLSTNATFNDLVYVDMTLLEVEVKRLANGSREISWASVSGKTNTVQYSTNLLTGTPTWALLERTSGTGNRMKVVDSAPAGQNRFYRVRVVY